MSGSTVWEVVAPDPAALQSLGEALGRVEPSGACVALLGDLGAGKTTLTQGIGRGLGIESGVLSPTFGLMAEHPAACPLLHVDAYRLRPGEADGIGLEEVLERWPGVAVVEWADLVVEHLPAEVVFVRLELHASGRRMQVWSTAGAAPVVAAWRAEVP